MHAWHAVSRGHEVVQIERESEARGASLRNFGQIWVSGRAGGEELETALRARELWEALGERVPGLGFRACGSLTPLRTAREVAVAEAAVAPARRGGARLQAAHRRRGPGAQPRPARHVHRRPVVRAGRGGRTTHRPTGPEGAPAGLRSVHLPRRP
ncbi:FAD-dependent oxidoreductase [Streptomyces sp. S1A(2023)]